MKMYFKYENSYKELYFENLLMFHGSIDNQQKLYESILKGLQGGSKDFLLNNEPVVKKSLNVIEFSSNSVFDDLKLTSKSYNLKILESILDENDDEIIEIVNQGIGEVEKKLKQKYQTLSDEYSMITPEVKFTNIRKILMDNFTLADKEDVNISVQVELELMVILNFIKMNPNKEYYLLIKHFNHLLDISQMSFIVEKIKGIENVTTLIFVKSFELFEMYDYLNINHVMIEHEIFKLSSEYDVTNSDLLTEDENEKMLKLLSTCARYQAYNSLINERDFIKKADID